MQLFVREFNTNTVYDTDTNTYPLSSYFPEQMRDALKKAMSKNGYIRKSDYILGPIYKSGDVQIGCTGTVENNEEMDQAMIRELGEEIGIVPLKKSYLFLVKKYTESNRTFHVYESYIKHCIPVLDHQHGAVLSRNKDSKNKVGCYIYGDKKTVLNFLNSETINIYKNTDSIIGVGAIRAGLVADFYRF